MIDPVRAPTAHPPIHRSSMVARPWAGAPLLRPVRWVLGHRPARTAPAERRDRALLPRRVVLLLLVALGAFIGTDYMADLLPKRGDSAVELALLALFGVLFAWISAGFWTAVMGLWVVLRGSDRKAARAAAAGGTPAPLAPEARTAVIMPICNEDVTTVYGGLRATIESVAATADADGFDFFVLSDTGDPDIRAAEQAGWSRLVGALQREAPRLASRVHYRWRQLRTRRKAGNVADFCRRFGRDYRYMVVLDADSVMTGDCLVSLVRMMEAQPDTGIIQTAPRAIGHTTVHARVQQFGSRVYGPLFTAGMHFWQLGESHYWGHNAILRMAPFIEHCALAPLPGSGSLSGDVMSHDFVEAALMRRAGYRVRIAPELDGSYEQLPPNLLAELQRDRRWCHGNLQNARLMFEPGLHPVHRTVFVTGVMAYLSAPLWLAFLILSSVLFASHAREIPRYFIEPYQLFPIWPNTDLKLMLTLFGLTALLLLGPKLLSLALIVGRGQARGFGGVARLLGGAVLEFLHSMLLAPVRMLFHTQFVLAALTGWKLAWKSPPRNDAATGWREAVRRHGLHTLLAAGWITAVLLMTPTFPWWLSPVIVGLLVAIPLSAWSSRAGPGRWLRERGIFVTPEECDLPRVLRQARLHAQAFGHQPSVVDAVVDAESHALVSQAMPARPAARGAKARARARLVEDALATGPQGLRDADRMRLLGDSAALSALHTEVQRRRAHPGWWNATARTPQPPRRVTEPVPVEAVPAAR